MLPPMPRVAPTNPTDACLWLIEERKQISRMARDQVHRKRLEIRYRGLPTLDPPATPIAQPAKPL